MTRGRYRSADDAAIAAIRDCLPYSIASDLEHRGLIWEGNEGGFDYTFPMVGHEGGTTLDGFVTPVGTTEVGNYHTHGDYTANDSLGRTYRVPRELSDQADGPDDGIIYIGDYWSVVDLETLNNRGRGRRGYRAYLGTAGGQVRYMEAGTGAEGLLMGGGAIEVERPPRQRVPGVPNTP